MKVDETFFGNWTDSTIKGRLYLNDEPVCSTSSHLEQWITEATLDNVLLKMLGTFYFAYNICNIIN